MKKIYLLPYEFEKKSNYNQNGAYVRKDLNGNICCSVWFDSSTKLYENSCYINSYKSFDEAAKMADHFMISGTYFLQTDYEIIEEKDAERFKEKLRLLI